MKTETDRRSGFTLVEIMIVVAIIALLAAIAIPNFARARNSAQQRACINNLRLVDGAIQQWALENRKSDIDIPTSDQVKVYLKNNLYPTCPGKGIYIITSLGGFAGSSAATVICTKVLDPRYAHNYMLDFGTTGN